MNGMALITNLIIAPNTSDTFKLYIWIEETDENQLGLLNQSFSAKVRATGEYVN